MLDYVMLMFFTQKEIASFNVIGNYYPSKLTNIILSKEIKQQENSDVLVFYNKNFHEILEKISPQFQWIIVYNDNPDEILKIYKSMRSFSNEVFFDSKNFLMIFHNLKQNYIELINQSYFEPIKESFIDDFLKLNITEKELLTKFCVGEKEEQLYKSLITQNEFIYVGLPISEIDILKCQMIYRMNFPIITCMNGTQVMGYFFHDHLKEKFWIYLLSNSSAVKSIYHFDELIINIPVRNV